LPSKPYENASRAQSAGEAHIDRLNALWKLSVERGLSDAAHIRAMLEMAARVLDRIGAFPEGTTLAVDAALCRQVRHTQQPYHVADLSVHPEHANDPLVVDLGLRTYSGSSSATRRAGCSRSCAVRPRA